MKKTQKKQKTIKTKEENENDKNEGRFQWVKTKFKLYAN